MQPLCSRRDQHSLAALSLSHATALSLLLLLSHKRWWQAGVRCLSCSPAWQLCRSCAAAVQQLRSGCCGPMCMSSLSLSRSRYPSCCSWHRGSGGRQLAVHSLPALPASAAVQRCSCAASMQRLRSGLASCWFLSQRRRVAGRCVHSLPVMLLLLLLLLLAAAAAAGCWCCCCCCCCFCCRLSRILRSADPPAVHFLFPSDCFFRLHTCWWCTSGCWCWCW